MVEISSDSTQIIGDRQRDATVPLEAVLFADRLLGDNNSGFEDPDFRTVLESVVAIFPGVYFCIERRPLYQ